VTPGTAVESPVEGLVTGVSAMGGTAVKGEVVFATMTGSVSVTKINGVGVTAAGVEEPHAVSTMANRTTPMKRVKRIFEFMGLFS
jgi:hypothetical protein